MQSSSVCNKNSLPVNIMLWVCISTYTLFYGVLCFLKYQHFGYKDFDLAVHSQVLWNITGGGSIESSILGLPFLGNHSHFILFFVAIIYSVFKHPLTLLFLQTIFLAVTAYPIYLLSRKYLSQGISFVIAVIYLFYPGLGYSNLFEFHPTAFAVLFLTLMLYFFEENNFLKFTIFMGLSLLCQENISLVILPIGFYAMFLKRSIKWILTPIVVSIIWFLTMVLFVIPFFNNNTIQFFSIYQHLGSTPFEIVKFMFSNPVKVISFMFTPQNFMYVVQLFLPVVFIPFFDASIFMILPVFFQHLLSARPAEHTIYFHYTLEMIPLIFFSTILATKRIIGVFKIKSDATKFVAIIFGISFFTGVYFFPLTNGINSKNNFRENVFEREKKYLVDKIPFGASVVSTFEFLPRLSNRKGLYSFHHVVSGFYTLSNKPYKLPDDTEFVLVDFDDFLTKAFFRKGVSGKNIENMIMEKSFGLVEKLGNIILLKKDLKTDNKLYEFLSKEEANIKYRTNAFVDNNLNLLGYDVKEKFNIGPDKIVPIVFFWSILEPTEKDYGCFIDITDNATKQIKYRFIKPVCYRIYPTYLWQSGNILKEYYNLIIPNSENVSVSMGIFEYDKNNNPFKICRINSDVCDDKGRLEINVN